MRLTASAPGKLILLGEYAVLFGHPAVVAAVNRRANVAIAPSGRAAWTVNAPGFHDRSVDFELGPAGLDWRPAVGDVASRFRLLEAVLGQVLGAGRLEFRSTPAAALTLDTAAFFERLGGREVKLGLGSSAALTVALAAAVSVWSAPGPPPDLGALLELHRAFQGGRGSGIDLAASLYGGALAYRIGDGGRSPTATPLCVPDGLLMVPVWTGRAASTTELLSRLDAAREANGNAVDAVLDALGAISARGAAAFGRGDTSGILDAVRDFADWMAELGSAAGMPVVSNEHEVILQLARGCGICYKPSGAGGGDIGVGFADDPDAAALFAQRVRAAGFLALDLSVDPTGLEIRRPESKP